LALASLHPRTGEFELERETRMEHPSSERWTRRRFLSSLTVGCASVLAACPSESARAEAPPETTRLRLGREPSVCLAPQYGAEELLRAEGFTQVEYVPVESVGSPPAAIASGKADLIADAAPALVLLLDAGEPITVLGGIHAGCYELFGTERVRTI